MKSEAELKQLGYSDKAAGIITSCENIRKINSADILLTDQEECGDIITLYIKTEGDTIADSSYEYKGCIGLQLAGTVTTKLIKGLPISSAIKIGFDDVINYAGKVPENKQECIHFTINTLRKALLPYVKN